MSEHDQPAHRAPGTSAHAGSASTTEMELGLGTSATIDRRPFPSPTASRPDQGANVPWYPSNPPPNLPGPAFLHPYLARQSSGENSPFYTPPIPTEPSGSGHPPIATLDESSGSAQKNRKRKNTSDHSMNPPPSTPTQATSHTKGSSPGSSAAATAAAEAAAKRTKTQRACDPCRRKKIRCDIVPDSEPAICVHCKNYGHQCTFFLPITETRWKKKLADERAAQEASKSTETPSAEMRRSSSSDLHSLAHVASSQERNETRIYGPTSLTYILHSSSTLPAMDSFDLRYSQTWSVGRSGEGFIQVHEQNASDEFEESSGTPRQETVERDVLERLVNHYFKDLAPIFPVITESEFVHGIRDDGTENYDGDSTAPSVPTTPTVPMGPSQKPRKRKKEERTHKPSPVLLYAICTIAATSRDVPVKVFESLRIMLQQVIKADDVMSTASLANIQALLILGMAAEPHGRVGSYSMSTCWLRVSTAIRMAQDLGLHRAEAVKTNIGLRRRLWAACVISDRWFGLTLGLPCIIDVHDCDARLPGIEIQSPPSPEKLKAAESLAFMSEMVKLSVILGKVMKTIYSPTGLIHTTDDVLEHLLEELNRFTQNMPDEFVFRGPQSSIFAGLLHLFHTAVCMMFWRVFARIQYSIPAHLRFAMSIERWSALTKASGEAIEWLEAHEKMYDHWIFIAYCTTSCALVQYHTWARRKDEVAQDSLRRLRDVVKRWDRAVGPGHMVAKRKTSEIVSLLFEATQSPVPLNFWPLNPTAGVEARTNQLEQQMVWRRDPAYPGGGLFIAARTTVLSLGGNDLPDGLIVLADSEFQKNFPEASRAITQSVSPPNTSGIPPNPGPAAFVPQPPKPLTEVAVPVTHAGGKRQHNVNPNINTQMTHAASAPDHVQVLNILDQPGEHAHSAAVNDGLLDGIPASLFEFDQWDNFFSRFQNHPDTGEVNGAKYANNTSYDALVEPNSGSFPPPAR